MATSTEIKTSIDANITNKTLPGTIDNTLVGADVKSVVDYVDQEITALNAILGVTATSNDYNDLYNLPTASVVKTLKTTINQAAILTLNTVPVIVLPHEANIIKIPMSCFIVRNGAGTNYTLAADMYLATVATGSIMQIQDDVLTTAGKISVGYLNSMYSITTAFDLDYTLNANISDPTGGTGSIDVYVTYSEASII